MAHSMMGLRGRRTFFTVTAPALRFTGSTSSDWLRTNTPHNPIAPVAPRSTVGESLSDFPNVAVQRPVITPREADADIQRDKKGEREPGDGEGVETEATIGDAMKLFARHLWPANQPALRFRVAFSVVLVGAAKICKVAIPLLFKRIIDGMSDEAAVVEVAATTGGLVGISTGALIVAYGLGRLVTSVLQEGAPAVFSPVGSAAANNVSLEVFKKLHDLDQSYHASRQTGQLVKEIDRASRAFSNISRTLLFVLIPTAMELTLASTMLTHEVGWEFAAGGVAVVVVYSAFTYVVTSWRRQFRKNYIAADNKVGAALTDSLLNYDTVKFFQNEEHEFKKIDTLNKEVNAHVWRLERTMAMMNFGQQAIFATAATASLYTCSGMVASGSMTLGSLVMVDTLLVQLYQPIASLGTVFRDLNTGAINLQATLALLRTPIKPDLYAGSDMAIIDPQNMRLKSESTIEFANVTFKYPNGVRPILDDVSFRINNEDQVVGIVGPSGSGKSTILRLLYRFFDPQFGTVHVGGKEAVRMDIKQLRSALGVVPQEVIVFDDTVMNNIRYGRLSASDHEVIVACRQAQLHDTILQLPDGYNTMLGQVGVRLSGGEKQRLGMARVFVKGSPIILADEPTSSLDSATETALIKTLLEYVRAEKSRMVIMVAHRLDTLVTADKIVCLDNVGHVAEVGSHDQLLAKEGQYFELWTESHGAKTTVIR